MAMKKKNLLPDMYSPEKKFSGFLRAWNAGAENKKKNLQNQLQKEQERADTKSCISYYCIFLILYKMQPAKRLPDFYKKAKIYRNSGGKNNETF